MLSDADCAVLFQLAHDSGPWLAERGLHITGVVYPRPTLHDRTGPPHPLGIMFGGPGEITAEVIDKFSILGPGTVTIGRAEYENF